MVSCLTYVILIVCLYLIEFQISKVLAVEFYVIFDYFILPTFQWFNLKRISNNYHSGNAFIIIISIRLDVNVGSLKPKRFIIQFKIRYIKSKTKSGVKIAFQTGRREKPYGRRNLGA